VQLIKRPRRVATPNLPSYVGYCPIHVPWLNFFYLFSFSLPAAACPSPDDSSAISCDLASESRTVLRRRCRRSLASYGSNCGLSVLIRNSLMNFAWHQISRMSVGERKTAVPLAIAHSSFLYGRVLYPLSPPPPVLVLLLPLQRREEATFALSASHSRVKKKRLALLSGCLLPLAFNFPRQLCCFVTFRRRGHAASPNRARVLWRRGMDLKVPLAQFAARKFRPRRERARERGTRIGSGADLRFFDGRRQRERGGRESDGFRGARGKGDEPAGFDRWRDFF